MLFGAALRRPKRSYALGSGGKGVASGGICTSATFNVMETVT
jgi:hypothetical protein